MVSAFPAARAAAEPVYVPEVLKPWVNWVVAPGSRDCPPAYNDARRTFCSWPSRLAIEAGSGGGKFSFDVVLFAESWLALPGDAEAWPRDVKANGAAAPVLERAGVPAVRLPAGTYRIEGSFHWSGIPQRIAIPPSIGILSLVLDGKAIEMPAWDSSGLLWLRRESSAEESDKDFLGVKIYSLLEDGIPLWLRGEIELVVSGKSREEDIGTILPEGWKLASVDGPIPVAIDDAGRMRAQVRPGRWTIRTTAFRTDSPAQLKFAEGAKPAVTEELIAFRAKPDFRLIELTGAPLIDVSQTMFPDPWRTLPVYRWETSGAITIEERLRGSGLQNPAGLAISREWWLDETGKSLTFRDRISGQRQEIWRLDAAAGQDLGSVRNAGEGQLITRNPATGAPGVEVRTRELSIDATGKMPRAASLPASGWMADADSLRVDLNLPPGWRLFALFGADWSRGDWLTTWTLLDLFVLVIFSLAVFRLWGPLPAVIAFVAFGLSYHEPGAPRFVWLALLVPLALLRVVKSGRGLQLLKLWKWATVVVLIFSLTPFLAGQIQQAIYPQLERLPAFMPRAVQPPPSSAMPAPEMVVMEESADDTPYFSGEKIVPQPQAAKMRNSINSNLLYDSKARIQTGPGVPEWSWRRVAFGWNGPVPASQDVRPILIPLGLERVLSILRVALLLLLAAFLLRTRSGGTAGASAGGTIPAVALAFAFLLVGSPAARAQFPDPAMLDSLRERLNKPDDAFPMAADISSANLTLTDRRVTMEVEVQSAVQVAVPLPGRLPDWSPLTVTRNGQPEASVRREDGFLWVVIPAGVHRLRVEGMLPAGTEWECAFPLRPRSVRVDAPEWTWTGVRADGQPEPQIFFSRKQKATGSKATYERQDLQNLVLVDRKIELGLVWQVRTTVSRLTPDGRAISVRVPVLPGENVVTANLSVRDGFIEVALGANDQTFTWESELPLTNDLALETRREDPWVERWQVVASPVWNVGISGLAPTFDASQTDLVPVWHPWPGESVQLAISRPEAIAGATVTVREGTHEVTLGKRQRTSKLTLSLVCSLGEDFPIGLPPQASVTSLEHDGKTIPVRIEGGRLLIPVRPGEQSISVGWREDLPLGFSARAGEVRLPVESANIETIIRPPDNRWTLWTAGPLRGPAVRFWTILAVSLVAAWALSRLRMSPLRAPEWMLLGIGLTQVPLAAALAVVAWLLFLEWRGRPSFVALSPWPFRLLQLALVVLTAASLGIFIVVVAEGLLGNPEMFIAGNDSTRSVLRWYAARSGEILPMPECFTVSIWWYRLLMLAWALWLAASLLRWLAWGWKQFCAGGCWKRAEPKAKPVPPELPTA